jgi:hypothetical protein
MNTTTLDLISKTLKKPLLREAYDNFGMVMDKDQRTTKSFTDFGFEHRMM